VVGPLLDHFRHGRRYALATTMLGRAFLAYVISDNLLGFGLYPAAFGVLALSRAYGVARSAAVPRLLPEGVGLSQVGARASVYGTFAGAVVAPIGLAAFWFGPQWPLRVASIIFIVGMVIALRLPPRADSDPPEAVPRPFRTMLRLRRGEDRPLSGSLVINALINSAGLRCLYGFVLLYFAFAIKADQVATTVLGRDIGSQGAVAVVGGALVIGTFLATAIGTRLQIRRPAALQSSGLTITAGVAVLTVIFYNLPMVALLAMVGAIFSGLAKLAVDASIQERVPERLRASAFAHSETVLMIAWVIGGAIGIIPLGGRYGVALGALIVVAAAVRAAFVLPRLRSERLHGRPSTAEPAEPAPPASEAPGPPPRDGSVRRDGSPRRDGPSQRDGWRADEPADPWPDAPTVAPPSSSPFSSAPSSPTSPLLPSPPPPSAERKLDTTLVEQPKRRFGFKRKKPSPPPAAPPSTGSPAPDRAAETPRSDPAMAPRGYHIYRPSSAGQNPGESDDDR
jgi:hypothetical protein